MAEARPEPDDEPVSTEELVLRNTVRAMDMVYDASTRKSA